MFDIRGILFWILVFATLYFLGPASIYLIGLLTLLCSLCSSCLSSFSTVKVVPMTGTGGLGDFDIVPAMNYSPGLPSGVPNAVKMANMANMATIGGVPGVARVAIPDGGIYAATQCGGNYGNNGFDMTADQVYAAFRDHPYNREDLGYGYYDGYDYVL